MQPSYWHSEILKFTVGWILIVNLKDILDILEFHEVARNFLDKLYE